MISTIGTQIAALAIVAAMGLVGGIIIGLLFGFKLPAVWKFPGYRFPQLIKVVAVPPLILMIIMGCIARNYFGDIMLSFPSLWSQYIRSICLGILLIRGGLKVTFQGVGIHVALLSIIP
jgi:hypothetical protein